ncbi:MAG: hypothetical protein U0228_09515 [Myxococcaceae bacterium]
MVLRLAALLALTAVPPPSPPPAKDSRAECMKSCAGSARSADGKHLLACIRECNAPDASVVDTSDAGVP